REQFDGRRESLGDGRNPWLLEKKGLAAVRAPGCPEQAHELAINQPKCRNSSHVTFCRNWQPSFQLLLSGRQFFTSTWSQPKPEWALVGRTLRTVPTSTASSTNTPMPVPERSIIQPSNAGEVARAF